MAIDGYMHASKVTDEYTNWAAVFLLTNKNEALQSLQLFIGSTVILFGGRIVCWRADKGSEYTGYKLRQYCLKTSIIQGFAAINTQPGCSGRGELDRIVHDGGTAPGGSSDNEGRGVLLQLDVGAGL